jgi:DNA-binding transcriptional regulator YhcF (GntR family)
MDVFEVTLDRQHPTPLYHQIATAVRWKIGTGILRPGELLPPLRAAAEVWGVSYHTVRRAYSELVRAGFVESTRGDGTRVVRNAPASRAHPGEDVQEFVREIALQARTRYALGPRDLASLLTASDSEAPVLRRSESPEAPAGPVVTMVECNALQASDLAGQLSAACSVAVLPWHLVNDGEPPPGLIVGTRFHQAEMLARWPDRAADMVFAALRMDPHIPQRVSHAFHGKAPLVMVERDVGTGHQHATDLARLTDPPAEITVTTELPSLDQLDHGPTLFVIAPRLCDAVHPAILTHPRVFVPRHLFDPSDLDSIRDTLYRRSLSHD